MDRNESLYNWALREPMALLVPSWQGGVNYRRLKAMVSARKTL